MSLSVLTIAFSNAHLFFAEFLQVMTSSMEALIDSIVLLSYLTPDKISNGFFEEVIQRPLC